jgi:galactose-1-phosphate uridylyltransferase
METHTIEKVIDIWRKEYLELGKKDSINYVQIF